MRSAVRPEYTVSRSLPEHAGSVATASRATPTAAESPVRRLIRWRTLAKPCRLCKASLTMHRSLAQHRDRGPDRHLHAGARRGRQRRPRGAARTRRRGRSSGGHPGRRRRFDRCHRRDRRRRRRRGRDRAGVVGSRGRRPAWPCDRRRLRARPSLPSATPTASMRPRSSNDWWRRSSPGTRTTSSARASPATGGRCDRTAGSATSLLTVALSVVARRWITDGQSGYRALSADAARSAEIAHDYNYAQVLTLDLLAKGYRYAEVPISYHFRTHGRSFVRLGPYLRHVVPAVWRMNGRPSVARTDARRGSRPVPRIAD